MRYGRGMRGPMPTRRLVPSPLCADMGGGEMECARGGILYPQRWVMGE